MFSEKIPRSIPSVLLLAALSFTADAQRADRSRARANGIATDNPDQSGAVSRLGAYSHLFMIVAPPKRHPPEQLADRQQSFIKHMNLDAEQGQILIDVASKYREYLVGLQDAAQRVAGPPEPLRPLTPYEQVQLEPLAKAKQQVILSLILELHERLDDQGDRIVIEYVAEEIEPKIRIRGANQQ